LVAALRTAHRLLLPGGLLALVAPRDTVAAAAAAAAAATATVTAAAAAAPGRRTRTDSGGDASSLLPSFADAVRALLDPQEWVGSSLALRECTAGGAAGTDAAPVVVLLRRRRLRCNTVQVGWKQSRGRNAQAALERELGLLEEITVTRSAAELRAGASVHTAAAALTVANRARAAAALRDHGVTVIRGLFRPEEVSRWAEHVLCDFEHARRTLLDPKHGIDLMEPLTASGNEGEDPQQQAGYRQETRNFHELAMREDCRCDLRNGPRMKRAIATAAVADAAAVAAAGQGAAPPLAAGADLTEAGDAPTEAALLFGTQHPAILQLLQEVCNPTPASVGGDDADIEGNWGRWNFGGGGPGAPKLLSVGRVGAVISWPGAADQAVHADTPHLYEHMHLPPHYVNLFAPAPPSTDASGARPGETARDTTDQRVGQTAFIAGSHKLGVCSRLMRDWSAFDNGNSDSTLVVPDIGLAASAQAERAARLVRPHLDAGDVLLFDCRVLHFGLANRGEPGAGQGYGGHGAAARRAVLYVNYHQPWFEDKKNWVLEKLFNEEDYAAA